MTRFLHLLGVAKAGTTSLFELLANHPDVAGSDPKETDDLAAVGRQDRRTWPNRLDVSAHARAWWSPGADGVRLTAAGCVAAPAPFASLMAASFPPPSQALVIIREPVDRLVSAYRFGRSLGVDPGLDLDAWATSLLDAHEAGRPTPLEMFHGVRGGEYGRLLRPWVAAYGPRLGVVFTEDLAAVDRLTSALAAWCDLSPSGWPALHGGRTASNPTVPPRSTAVHRAYRAMARRLRPVARRLPVVRRAVRRLYQQVNTAPPPGPLSDEVRSRLQDHYAAANADLADLLAKATVFGPAPSWVPAGPVSSHGAGP